MFDSNLFQKNQFILEKIKYEYQPDEKKAQKSFHIGLNINDAYFMQLGVAITSVFESNPQTAFCIHIFCDSASTTNLQKVEATAKKYQQNVYVYIIDMEPFQAFHIKVKRMSRVTYIRSIMPKILQPFTDKFLYMDADMICVNDITVLEKLDMQEYPIAAVSEKPGAVKYKTTFLHQKSGKHFNDGMMWIDIASWEREHVTERVWEYQGADPNRFSGQSQDIMNLVLDGELLFIDNKFNSYPEDYVAGETVIAHFLGRDKPWQMIVCDADRMWRYYLDLSVWPNLPDNNIPKKPANYHNFKRMMKIERDRHNYGAMVYNAFWYSVLKIQAKVFGTN